MLRRTWMLAENIESLVDVAYNQGSREDADDITTIDCHRIFRSMANVQVKFFSVWIIARAACGWSITGFTFYKRRSTLRPLSLLSGNGRRGKSSGKLAVLDSGVILSIAMCLKLTVVRLPLPSSRYYYVFEERTANVTANSLRSSSLAFLLEESIVLNIP